MADDEVSTTILRNHTIDVCNKGLILPLFDEGDWNETLRGILYFAGLIYCFIGVSVITDIFMSSIVAITSTTRKIYLAKAKITKNGSYNSITGATNLPEDQPEVIEVRVWNDTVANLTLMALGTSAPEILLACIEIIGHKFESGELGPGTIVGSAAYNLLIISAICIISIPTGESRRIRQFKYIKWSITGTVVNYWCFYPTFDTFFGKATFVWIVLTFDTVKVFIVTTTFSILAYIWMFIAVKISTPGQIDLWEAILTFLMFPALIGVAYAADKGWFGLKNVNRNKRQIELGAIEQKETDKMLVEKEFFKDGQLNKNSLVAFVREVKKYPGLSDQDAALLAAAKIAHAKPHTQVHYRIGAVRDMTGGRKLKPQLTLKLKEVYDALNEHPLAPTLGDAPENPAEDGVTVVEFHSATCAVRENIGTFPVTLWRHGNPEPTVKVRVRSVDGSAKSKEDYIPIDEVITFESGEIEKKVEVRIVDDNKWEPAEEFFLKLSLIDVEDSEAIHLGRVNIMEIIILDDDNPGIVQFDRRGILVKESAGTAALNILRKNGSDGEITVQWRTIDKSAISGRDFKGGSGEIKFGHLEIIQTIEIPIIDDLRPERDECFEVEIVSATDGAKIGNINRIAVTITNDDAFNNVVDKMMVLTRTNVDAIAVHRNTWCEQIRDALSVNGGDLENATTTDYILHLLAFNWKVIFSLIPPPTLLGGWLCFFTSLAAVGIVTAIIGDIASVFGCVVGLKDSITAITFVAIGTSLPDSFASRTAAVTEKYADNAIGNITGSNSVNVFLGLGLPWLLAAIYHYYQETVFYVPADSLGLGVLLFMILGLIAVCLIIARRNLAFFGNSELGGPPVPKYLSCVILCIFWCIYIVVSCLSDYKIINVDF